MRESVPPSRSGAELASLPPDDDSKTETVPEPVPKAPVPAPETFIGRYVVQARVGRGGMADVVSAHDPLLNRTVAIKLLVVHGDSAHVRLMREAQAMARVRHPNVVSVYDFGDYSGGVFLTMEFVEGGTLRTWMRERARNEASATDRRAWHAVVAMFVGAGRGLAAAHHVGLVHRDFKPENVLIDATTGQAKVTDFGLAHGASSHDTRAPRSAPPPASSPSEPASRDLLSTPLTHAGVIQGTPQYMAPEQHEGGKTDARADQFAFCVALFEALSGERPFRGATRAELVASMREGRIEPQAAKRVPAALLPVLARGLAWRPEDRHPSMDALLAELTRRAVPRGKRAALVAGAALMIVAGGTTLLERAHARTRACRAEGESIASAWNPEVEATARAAFERSDVPGAARLWETTRAIVDGYAREWSRAAEAACTDRTSGRVSDEAAKGPRACLDRRRAELGQTARLLQAADATLVRRSVEAVSSLSSLETCAEADARFGADAAPSDPAAALQVDALRRTLGEVKALNDAERGADALSRITPLMDEARRIGFAPLVAAGLREEARALVRAKSDPTAAAGRLDEAYRIALTERDFTTAGRAAADLTDIVGHNLGKHREGHAWARLGEAALGHGRSREADLARMELLLQETYVFNEEEDSIGATRAAGEALRLSAERKPSDLRMPMRLHVAMGVAYATAGDLAAAERELQAGVVAAEALFGPDHPVVSDRLSDLASALFSDAKLDEAVSLLDRAFAINGRTRPPDHMNSGINLLNRGEAHRFRGDVEAALADYQGARAIFVVRLGEDAADLVPVDTGAAECLRRLGRAAEGLGAIERAERIAAKGEAQPAALAEMRFVHAKLLADLGRDAPAADELAEKAWAYYATNARSPIDQRVRGELERWIDAHRATATRAAR